MKVALIVSGALLLLLACVCLILMFPPAEAPTNASAPAMLVKVGLPEDLPPLYTVAAEASDPEPEYAQAIKAYESDPNAFAGRFLDEDVVGRAARHLIAASKAGPARHGFLDQAAGVSVGGGRLDTPLGSIAQKVLELAAQQHERGQTREAIETASAVYALGERAFTRNDLLGSRQLGLSIMIGAASALLQFGDDPSIDQAAVALHIDALNRVLTTWEPKLRVVKDDDPNVGDLLTIARHDQDLTFRVAATAWCGVAKYTTGNATNKRKIRAYLKEAQSSDEPLIAAAASAAAALTKDDFHRIR